MPPRQDLTPEVALRRAERKRESDRLAQRRRRARQHDETVSMTRQSDGSPQRARQHDGPPGPPVLSEASLREIEEILSSLKDRGYVHSPPFWQLLRVQYPALNLAFEAWKLADWFEQPKNARRKCSKAFLSNWLSKAEQDRQQREAPPTFAQGRAVMTEAGPQRVPDGVPKGVVVNGTWHPPAAFQRNPGPPPDEAVPLTGPLERIGEAELRAVRDATRHLTLAQKAARLTNGVHK